MNFRFYVRYMKKNAMFLLVTMMLIFSISLFMGMTVSSKGTSNLSLEEHYRLLEQDMVRDVRHYLNEHGYRNSGITLTRVVDEAENRAYTLTVHHDKIEKMDDAKRAELSRNLLQFGFEFTTCSFETAYLFH